MNSKILTIAIVAIFSWLWLYNPEVSHGPGIIAPQIPKQTRDQIPVAFYKKGYHITPVATFDITARVLSREDYRFDKSADLIPTDLALGWGKMSDESVLKDIDISQSGRFYYWSTKRLPIPAQEIIRSSANMHLIPANDSIKDAIRSTRRGNLVRFTGFLVNVKNKENGILKSSLTRADSGAGACEVIWVEDFSILK